MLAEKIKKHLQKLEQKKFRKDFGEFIVEGIKGTAEALKSDFDIALILIEGKRRDENEIKKIILTAEKKGIIVEYADRKDLEKISDTETFPGVLSVVVQKEFFIEDFLKEKNIIALDAVNDPGNLGTIIRTADWFGIKKIILSENSVDLYNSKVVRSTMGSIFHVDILRVNDFKRTLEKFKKENFVINSLDLNGESIEKMSFKDKNIFLFGNESHGLAAELEKFVDKRYTIKGYGQAESLNLAISAGIVMYKIKK
ncbi:MAG: TrmH family RNA methyltransferase [Patescibacteria group bacterium]